MAKIPKPRGSGQTGGSAYNKTNRSTWASASVHQKAGSGGAKPPKKPWGCPFAPEVMLAVAFTGGSLVAFVKHVML
jgi:hypothetical protein